MPSGPQHSAPDFALPAAPCGHLSLSRLPCILAGAAHATAAEHVMIASPFRIAGTDLLAKEKAFFAAEGLTKSLVFFRPPPSIAGRDLRDIDFGTPADRVAVHPREPMAALKIIGA